MKRFFSRLRQMTGQAEPAASTPTTAPTTHNNTTNEATQPSTTTNTQPQVTSAARPPRARASRRRRVLSKSSRKVVKDFERLARLLFNHSDFTQRQAKQFIQAHEPRKDRDPLHSVAHAQSACDEVSTTLAPQCDELAGAHLSAVTGQLKGIAAGIDATLDAMNARTGELEQLRQTHSQQLAALRAELFRQLETDVAELNQEHHSSIAAILAKYRDLQAAELAAEEAAAAASPPPTAT